MVYSSNTSRPFPCNDALATLSHAICQAGGRPFVVGGAVRDHILGLSPQDIDIEVYDLSLEALEQVLKQLGPVHAVGKSFGILKVTITQHGNAVFDVALPRTENKSGRGHKGFVVEPNEKLSFPEAAKRRDFTMNAMGIELPTGKLHDPYKGISDLQAGILKHVSGAFGEDPLRVLRGAQFASRFALSMHPDTISLCKTLIDELATLPKERIFQEFKKLVLGEKPSAGLGVLQDSYALTLFPELVALIGCQQEKEWHPEGDVWIHTLMAMDQGARLVRAENLPQDEALIIMLAVLCHDLGKPSTTRFEDGRWRSKFHEQAGKAPTHSFLKRIGTPQDLIDAITPLVLEHLKPHQLYKVRDKVSDGAIRRLASRACIERLVLVNTADSLGRTTPDALRGEEPAGPWLLQRAKELLVHKEPEKPILLGRHLLELGVKAGPKLGKILEKAYEAQLEGVFRDLDGAMLWYQHEGSKDAKHNHDHTPPRR